MATIRDIFIKEEGEEAYLFNPLVMTENLEDFESLVPSYQKCFEDALRHLSPKVTILDRASNHSVCPYNDEPYTTYSTKLDSVEDTLKAVFMLARSVSIRLKEEGHTKVYYREKLTVKNVRVEDLGVACLYMRLTTF